MRRRWPSLAERFRRGIGRIRTRLLVVNLVVVLVPIAGLEFARLYERQLLDGLERDMQNQAALVKVSLEAGLARGEAFGTKEQEAQLTAAALQTRTRIRLVDVQRGVLVDSHRNGPPEGKEPRAPLLTRERAAELEQSLSSSDSRSIPHEPEVPIEKRAEILGAFKASAARPRALRVGRLRCSCSWRSRFEKKARFAGRSTSRARPARYSKKCTASVAVSPEYWRSRSRSPRA